MNVNMEIFVKNKFGEKKEHDLQTEIVFLNKAKFKKRKFCAEQQSS